MTSPSIGPSLPPDFLVVDGISQKVPFEKFAGKASELVKAYEATKVLPLEIDQTSITQHKVGAYVFNILGEHHNTEPFTSLSRYLEHQASMGRVTLFNEKNIREITKEERAALRRKETNRGLEDYVVKCVGKWILTVRMADNYLHKNDKEPTQHFPLLRKEFFGLMCHLKVLRDIWDVAKKNLTAQGLHKQVEEFNSNLGTAESLPEFSIPFLTPLVKGWIYAAVKERPQYPKLKELVDRALNSPTMSEEQAVQLVEDFGALREEIMARNFVADLKSIDPKMSIWIEFGASHSKGFVAHVTRLLTGSEKSDEKAP